MPYEPPWTYTLTWSYAVTLGNDRAIARHIRQAISWEQSRNQWKVSDT